LADADQVGIRELVVEERIRERAVAIVSRPRTAVRWNVCTRRDGKEGGKQQAGGGEAIHGTHCDPVPPAFRGDVFLTVTRAPTLCAFPRGGRGPRSRGCRKSHQPRETRSARGNASSRPPSGCSPRTVTTRYRSTRSSRRHASTSGWCTIISAARRTSTRPR